MKTTIEPIYRPDAEKAYRGLFTNEFLTQELGRPGHWVLWGAHQPALQNPIQLSDFERLLGQSPAAANEPVAWRLNFEVGRSTTTLWALTEKPTRDRIARGHMFAVGTSLGLWLPQVSQNIQAAPAPHPGAVFALFRSGTGEGQIPYLHTTAIFFNAAYLPNGQVTTFAADRVIASESMLDMMYTVRFSASLRPIVGRIDQSHATDVPRCLFPGLFEPAQRLGQESSPFDRFGGPFAGDELFAQWRRQAAERGFGPTQAKTVLRNARELEARLQPEQDARRSHPIAYQVSQWKARGTEMLQKARDSLHQLVSRKDQHVELSQTNSPNKNQMTHSH